MADLLTAALEDVHAGEVVREGLDYVDSLFSAADGVGTQLAISATRGLVANPDLVRNACTGFTRTLLERMNI